MPAAVESGKEFCRRAGSRHTKIAQKHKLFLKCRGFAFPRSSFFRFSILLTCNLLLNLSLLSILLQPPLTVQDDPELPAFLSLPPTRLGDWYPPTFPNTARACACAEPLLERTRCHHPGQPRQHRGCTICAKPASGRFVDRRVSPVSSDSSTSTGPSHILWIHTGAPSTSKQ